MFVLLFNVLLMCSYALAGSCPDAPLVDPFFLEQFSSGRWFEVVRYSTVQKEMGADCVYFDFDNQNNYYNYTSHQVVNGVADSFRGEFEQPGTVGIVPETVYVKEDILKFTLYFPKAVYDKFVIFYECVFEEDVQNNKTYPWMFSRTKTPSDEAMEAFNNYVATNDYVDSSLLKWNSFTKEACLKDL